jgi:hypothetical protein
MPSNKNIELLIAKIDDRVKLGLKSVLEKNKASKHPTVPIQKNGKTEWINLKETN